MHLHHRAIEGEVFRCPGIPKVKPEVLDYIFKSCLKVKRRRQHLGDTLASLMEPMEEEPQASVQAFVQLMFGDSAAFAVHKKEKTIKKGGGALASTANLKSKCTLSSQQLLRGTNAAAAGGDTTPIDPRWYEKKQMAKTAPGNLMTSLPLFQEPEGDRRAMVIDLSLIS